MSWKPYHPQTLFIAPFRGEGFTKSGIYIGYDDRLPPVLGRTDIGVVMFRPHTYETASSASGEVINVIAERAIAGILEGYDEETPNVKEYTPDAP